MARLLVKCPYCKRVADLVSESFAFGKVFKSYSCGHTVLIEEVKIPESRDSMWLQAREYQQHGVEFLEKSGFRALLADGMGLGKTIQVLLSVRYHWEDLTPTIYIVKSSLKYQWAAEYMKWALTAERQADLSNMPYIVTDGKMPILPGFKAYFISMDALKTQCEALAALNPRLLVVDESHNFKNPETARAIHLKKLASLTAVPHILCTSGTPILNRADEFFTTLNLLKPERFHSMKNFQHRWLEPNEKGKYTKIKSWALDDWQATIKPFILRREKREVLKDLPPFSRNFKFFEIEDPKLKAQYNSELVSLEKLMSTIASQNGFNSIFACLNRLRQLTGIAKVKPILEDVSDFLDGYETDKLIIGCHHKAVAAGLHAGLQEFSPVMISGNDSAESKNSKVEQFKDLTRRVAIVSTLACGEGLNLQFCNNMILAEREWNAAKEEQLEGRIDRFGQLQNTSADYYLAKGTIDEYFTDMVEDKRSTCAEALGDEFNIESNPEQMRKLAENILSGGFLQ